MDLFAGQKVAPARERGLKSQALGTSAEGGGRSREGAWIEMPALREGLYSRFNVAPARERGLKYPHRYQHSDAERRSREGAWIEIFKLLNEKLPSVSLPRGSVD